MWNFSLVWFHSMLLTQCECNCTESSKVYDNVDHDIIMSDTTHCDIMHIHDASIVEYAT